MTPPHQVQRLGRRRDTRDGGVQTHEVVQGGGAQVETESKV